MSNVIWLTISNRTSLRYEQLRVGIAKWLACWS